MGRKLSFAKEDLLHLRKIIASDGVELTPIELQDIISKVLTNHGYDFVLEDKPGALTLLKKLQRDKDNEICDSDF